MTSDMCIRKLFSFMLNGQYGLRDQYGQVIIEPELPYAATSVKGVSSLALDSKGTVAFFDTESMNIKRLEGWTSAGELSSGLLPVQSIMHPEWGIGYSNTLGEVVIQPQFYSAGTFDSFGANVRSIHNRNVYFRIDRKGEKRGQDFVSIRKFHPDGRYCGASLGYYSNEKNMVIIDEAGVPVSKQKFVTVWQEHEGKIPVEFDAETVGWTDTKGNIVYRMAARGIGNHFETDCVPLTIDGNKWGLLNSSGSWRVDPSYDLVESVGKNRYMLGQRTEQGGLRVQLTDSYGMLLCPTYFDLVGRFQDGFAICYATNDDYPFDEFDRPAFNYIDMDGHLVFDDWSQ